jgi:hypothetical protein
MSLIVDNPEHDSDIRMLLNKQIQLLEKIALSTDPAGALPVRLMANGSQQVAVNEAGEILVSDGPFDLAKFNELGTVDTAYNFFGPKGREQFVITGFLIYGDKDINDASDSTVIIYEATAPDTTTVSRTLVQAEIGSLSSIPFPNIRVLCNKGVYINAKTSDDDVHITIFGHYVDLQGKGETNG